MAHNPNHLERFSSARSAVLATIDAGAPHVVPIVFALDGDLLYSAVDHKPKTTTSLRRLENIRTNPHVSVLADHYEEDWDRLWWVRIDGTARIVDQGDAYEHALDRLAAKYPVYREHRPEGPVIVVVIDRVIGWSAS